MTTYEKTVHVGVTVNSLGGEDFGYFAQKVVNHIEGYAIPQYGDIDDDLVRNYSVDQCVQQIEKYAKRFKTAARPGEEALTLLKIAHFAQRAFDKLPKEAIK